MSKTVLVTGASGGIGAAIAAGFIREGHRVVLGCLHSPEKAKALCAQLGAGPQSALVAAADVADEVQVEGMFCAAEQAFGPVEILVNNAGIAQQKLFTDISLCEWQRMMDVHVTGSFLCSRRALGPMIRAKKGCIINIASMWGQVGAACEVHYSAAKAALIGLTKALAKEVAPSGVRVNCVAPGAVDAGMMEGFLEADSDALCAEIPLGRLGTAQEVASLALYLASDAAGYITGQVLGVNGGMVV